MIDEERDLDFILDEAKQAGWYDPTAFHEACGYRWDLHRTDILDNVRRSPFGCPSETTARIEWGR